MVKDGMKGSISKIIGPYFSIKRDSDCLVPTSFGKSDFDITMDNEPNETANFLAAQIHNFVEA